MNQLSKVKLDEVCNFEKGATGIKKAIPGKYPMVSLAEDRTTHNEYQFDQPAVLIPLVSSTGHGHASINRLHFQEGKFALGSILVALTPKDDKVLHPNYLYIYLSYFKDQLLVPLMRGAANVSLSLRSIKEVEIILPSYKKQIEIIQNEKKIKKTNLQLNCNIGMQKILIANLQNTILQEAVRGKLTEEWRKANPLKENNDIRKLIEKEYNNLEKKHKIFNVDIFMKSKPFNIPKEWGWCYLGIICNIQTGKRDVNEGSKNGKYNFFTCAKEPLKSDTYSFEGESLILPGNGANVGYVNYVNEKFEAYQRTYILNDFSQIIIPEYLYRVLQAYWKLNLGDQYGSAINFIKIGNLNNFLVPIPPLPEQEEIILKLRRIMDQMDSLNQKINKNKKTMDLLIKSVISESFVKK